MATFGPVALVTLLARRLEMPALVTLIAGGGILCVTGALLVWRMPGAVLGEDGKWMWETLTT